MGGGRGEEGEGEEGEGEGLDLIISYQELCERTVQQRKHLLRFTPWIITIIIRS